MVCQFDMQGGPGDARVAYHLDQMLEQCNGGYKLTNGHTYTLEALEDTQSLATTTFSVTSS